MKTNLLEFLYGVSQQETEIDNVLDNDFSLMLEQADAEEAELMKAEKSPLTAALKSIGISTDGLQEDPEGFALVTDDRDQYIEALNILSNPDSMHALASKGWVAFKCGDQAMTSEAPEFKLRFLEISTAETSDKDTAEDESEIIKKAREFATTEPEHDSDNPVDHTAPKGNDLKDVNIGKATDGKDPEGKIKDSLSAAQVAANLLEDCGQEGVENGEQGVTDGSGNKIRPFRSRAFQEHATLKSIKPKSGGKTPHAFKTAKKK